ncbi:ABC transporter permease subunit [Chloroflexota bacterium]
MDPAAENYSHLQSKSKSFLRIIRYLGGKILAICITIFIAVFLTVIITNQPTNRGLGPPESPFETSLHAQINLVIRQSIRDGTIEINEFGVPDQEELQAYITQLRNEYGVNLPYFQRYLKWTVKALTFDWGKVGVRQGSWGHQATRADVEDIILVFLPRSLLIIGAAYLLVFLIGMPISMYLSRNYGNWIDRFFSILSPISSVPSWVYGIILLSIFAFQLRWLPFGGMFVSYYENMNLEFLLDVGKHMIMPVAAIALSLLFQIIFTWRTYFVIYSKEDYIELAQAKGLPLKVLNKNYILRPSLPYIITSFVTTLITFWQVSMAVEVVFNWPGLGWLYIKEALPNFWGESMEPGELIIAIGIVVMFAYLMGIVSFLLDLINVIVDPRIRLQTSSKSNEVRSNYAKRQNWLIQIRRFLCHYICRNLEEDSIKPQRSFRKRVSELLTSLNEYRNRSKFYLREIRRFPSAIVGLTIIVILLFGSIYAVTAMPYEQIGKDYNQKVAQGRSFVPRVAMPSWTNLFTSTPRLSTLFIDQDSPSTDIEIIILENGWIEKNYTLTFDYKYKEIPSEIFLYFDPIFEIQRPHVTMEWEYPDGRILPLKRTNTDPSSSYDFEDSFSAKKILDEYPEWKAWFSISGNVQGLYSTPIFNLLFAKPGSSEMEPMQGQYTLRVNSLLFEPESDLELQLVLLGQVYGMAGSDYARRDLIVPLFWGMPFALLIGFLGSLITSLIAMLLPAAGVWFGGWFDGLIQRLTEINMIIPGLAIAVLANVLFNINIWIILGIIIVINALGSPMKIFRAAFLQAKESPYLESARAYGAGNIRIITHYLLPKVLPVLIPQLITQIPSFIFWEATLGFFNIKSNYPSWGRIIYDGLSRGALYGSPFWVLEPIALLLLTSLAFALLGTALEKILNPRTIEVTPVHDEFIV